MTFVCIFVLSRAAFAATVVALLAACAASTAVAPQPESSRTMAYAATERVPSYPNALRRLDVKPRAAHHVSPFDDCPATGQLEYVTYATSQANEITIFAGTFAGQAPCGQITAGLIYPRGLFVEHSTGDLYVADAGGN